MFLEVEWHCVIGAAEVLGVWEHGHGQSALLARYTKLCVNLIFELSEGTSREGETREKQGMKTRAERTFLMRQILQL